MINIEFLLLQLNLFAISCLFNDRFNFYFSWYSIEIQNSRES